MALFGFLGKLLDSNEREVNKLRPLVDSINELESEYKRLSAEDLKAKTVEFTIAPRRRPTT